MYNIKNMVFFEYLVALYFNICVHFICNNVKCKCVLILIIMYTFNIVRIYVNYT